MFRQSRSQQFRRITAEHGEFLKQVLWKMTGLRELFEEALQESLVRIWKHGSKVKQSTAKAYLYRIAQSAVAQAWANLKPMGAELTVEPHSAGYDAAQRPCDDGLFHRIRQAISRLPYKQSRAIGLRYFSQHDYAHIAQCLNCSEATARSHVSKGLVKLRSLFNNTQQEGIGQ